MCRTKIKSVKFVSYKATKKAAMENEETTSISSSDGWRSNCDRWYLDIKKYKTQASNTNWIANGTVPTSMINFLSASQCNTCQIIKQRTIFVSWNVVLCSAEYFRYNPRFFLRFVSGLRACSVLVTTLFAACAKILLDWHTCTCYNQRFHLLKLLKYVSAKIMLV